MTTIVDRSVKAYADTGDYVESILRASADNAITDIYRTIVERSGSLAETTGSATRVLGTAGTSPATTTPLGGASLFPLQPTDFAISGRTTKLSLRATCLTNATSHGTQTFTVHLYPVTAIAGGADVFALTLGASAASVQFVNPGTSSITTTTAADIAMPSAGLFMLGIHNSATIATDALAAFIASLRVRHTTP